jgi:hypothetical protein
LTYLLDANIFIQAKNLHYGLDFCPAFWDWLVENNAAGRVFSIEKVGDEIEAGADELAEWASLQGSSFFLKPDSALVSALGRVSTWVAGQSYEPAAVNTFLQVATIRDAPGRKSSFRPRRSPRWARDPARAWRRSRMSLRDRRLAGRFLTLQSECERRSRDASRSRDRPAPCGSYDDRRPLRGPTQCARAGRCASLSRRCTTAIRTPM